MIDMVLRKIEHPSIDHKGIIGKDIHSRMNSNKYSEHFLVALCQEELVSKTTNTNSIFSINL